jgi:hypothetical protein
MGGKHLTLPCTLSKNGYAVNIKALGDTRANGFSFIDTRFAVDLAKFLNVKAQRLPFTIPIKGYDGKQGNAISHIIRFHFTINGRRQYHHPFLILDLGNHDVILGREWFASFNVLVDCANRCLQWPANQPPSYSVLKEIPVLRSSLVLSPPTKEHQEDAQARDAAIAKEEQRREAGQQKTDAFLLNCAEKLKAWNQAHAGDQPEETGSDSGYESAPHACPSSPLQSHKWETQDSLKKMDQSLRGILPAPPQMRRLKKGPQQSTPSMLPIDIALISGVGFYYNMKREENELGTISLYEIDRTLEEREA